MNEISTASEFKAELESLSEIEVLENEEMWSIRIIDEVSSKESISGVILKFLLQDNPTQR